MFLFYALIGFVVLSSLIFLFGKITRRKIHMKVLSTQTVEGKDFLSIRLEHSDFLFMNDGERVHFIEALDDVEEFQIKSFEEEEGGESLAIPDREKVS